VGPPGDGGMADSSSLGRMIAVPATIPLGLRCDVQTSVVIALASIVWEVSAMLRPLLALPLAALVLALLAEVVMPALIVFANAD